MSEELYLAGEYVAPGVYRQIGGGRELHFQQKDYLPASLDGRVACYERIEHTWEQMSPQIGRDAMLRNVQRPH